MLDKVKNNIYVRAYKYVWKRKILKVKKSMENSTPGSRPLSPLSVWKNTKNVFKLSILHSYASY